MLKKAMLIGWRKNMKKLILLFTIACAAGQLYGMEPERGRYIGWGDLPKDVQVIIISYLQTYDDIKDILNAIQETSRTNKQLNAIVNETYGNQKGFAALMHVLEDKFHKKHPFLPGINTVYIASGLKTSAAKEYVRLVQTLRDALKNDDMTTIKNALAKGADINATFGLGNTFLVNAVSKNNLEETQLLLDIGADPNVYTDNIILALQNNLRKENSPEAEQTINAIKNLLEEAMRKKQQ